MKHNNLKSVVFLVTISCIMSFMFTACEDFFDKDPVNELTEEQYYQNEDDADAAVKGIYGKLANLAPQILILNELSADLMDVTNQVDEYYRQINLHTADSSNPYIDATGFYSIINDCNDALYNFDLMLKEFRISEDAYIQRYSDIAAIRSWLYLNLVVLYGEVPYITKPFNSVQDLKNIDDRSLYPYLDIETMVDSLYNFILQIPSLDRYSDASLTDPIEGFNSSLYFINKYILLGDLCLWKGDYYTADFCYRVVMSDYGDEEEYDRYKICYSQDLTNLDYYNSGYVRYYWNDVYSEVNSWPKMFSDMSSSTNEFLAEWIWVIFYDDDNQPYNPFYQYFSNTIGNYYFKPGKSIRRLWSSQVRQNTYVSDYRGLNGSYEIINGDPVITKFISMYDPSNAKNKQGKWGINRTAGLHLRFAEAANRYGQTQSNPFDYTKVAYALLNYGIQSAFDEDTTDKTTCGYTLLDPPFYFDGRKTDLPYRIRGEFHRNTGIRGRVYMQARQYETNIDSIDMLQMENDIIEEAALELAFEGNRWHDLVRIALRRNDPAFLADRVAAKFESAADSIDVHIRLMTRKNWFLPFK